MFALYYLQFTYSEDAVIIIIDADFDAVVLYIS